MSRLAQPTLIFNNTIQLVITVRIAHLRIAHWGAILSPSVIRIAHLNYYVFYALFLLDMGPGGSTFYKHKHWQCVKAAKWTDFNQIPSTVSSNSYAKVLP